MTGHKYKSMKEFEERFFPNKKLLKVRPDAHVLGKALAKKTLDAIKGKLRG